MAVIKMTHKHISWQTFFAFKDNTIQRNTEDRAIRAVHLHTWHPAHSVVYAARLPNGEIFKVEGHTRAYIYQSGEYEARPDGRAFLHLYDVQTTGDVEALYHIHNSRLTTKRAPDFVYGAYRKIGRFPKTSWFLKGQNSSALRSAYQAIMGKSGTSVGGVSIEAAAAELMSELLLLDTITPSRKRFSTGILVAALLTLRAYGEPALKFWDSYNRERGIKRVHGRDGVETLSHFHKQHSNRKSGGGGGLWLEAGYALGAFEQQQEKKFRKGDPEQIAPEQYLMPAQQAAE